MTTAIEWTDETWNPVTGCDKVSPGCDHCYAEGIANRFAGTKAFPHGFAVTLHPERMGVPLKWKTPRRVFVNSMSDLFHAAIPDYYIAHIFGAMARTPHHTYQVLTKRHGRMRSLLSSDRFRRLMYDWLTFNHYRWIAHNKITWPLPNVWLGVSVEDQARADLRIPALLETPAAVRFLSMEPLLGPVDITRWLRQGEPRASLDWVIVGGESGPGARPVDGDWVRSLRDQCEASGEAFFFKQWGGRTPKANGRELDGRTWDEYPERAA